MEASDAQLQSCQHAQLAGFHYLGLMAPLEPAWIRVNIIDQREHVRGGMFNKGTTLNNRHRKIQTSRLPRSVDESARITE